MAQVLKNLFGGSKSDANQVPSSGSDFADFAGAPDAAPGSFPFGSGTPGAAAQPDTKWYRVDQRHSLSEFKVEGVILAAIAVVVVLHLIGTRLNRSKARKWAKAHAGPLASEFALVGFNGVPPSLADKSGDELVQALADTTIGNGDRIIKEKSLFQFATYATGRQNVAFLDVKLTLKKRFNPFRMIFESGFGFFAESAASPEDVMEAIMYPFDGMEAATVPGFGSAKEGKSTYDGFVWAIVNKEKMKEIRDERFDLSITATKDSPKLPSWLSVMSENAEITDALLTPELIKAAGLAGNLLDCLVVSDQPVDQPLTLDDIKPRKRIALRYRLPSNNDYQSLVPLFEYFLRLPDLLVRSAHFRPEVTRKLKAVREEYTKKIKKADEAEKAEERAYEREKAKKAKREQELGALDAKAQKRYLEKEREKEQRRSMKKQTSRM